MTQKTGMQRELKFIGLWLMLILLLGAIGGGPAIGIAGAEEAPPKAPPAEPPKYTPKKPTAPPNNAKPNSGGPSEEEAVGEDSENGARWGSFGRDPISTKQEHQSRVPIYRRQ